MSICQRFRLRLLPILLALTLPLAAAPGTAPSPLVFTATHVTAPVVPGASSVWFHIQADSRRTLLSADFRVDSDRDGLVQWQRAATDPAGRSIWTVADMTSGRLMAGEPSGTIPLQSAFPQKMFLRDAAGHFSTLMIDVSKIPVDSPWYELLWVRPGTGAWTLSIYDAGEADLDGTHNRLLVVTASAFKRMSDAPTPAGFIAGDLLIGIDVDAYRWFGDAVDDHLREAGGPGVLSLLLSSGRYAEKSGVVRARILRREGSDGAVSIRYATENGTAVAGVHYEAVAGTLDFGPGEIIKTIEIPLINDLTYSGEPQFTFKLTDPVGATVTGGTSTTISIAEDDPSPKVAVLSDITRTEGGDGTHEVVLDVRLEGATRLPATMNWVAAPSAGTVVGSGEITFAPGETQKLITFAYRGNTVAESDRHYTIHLQNVQNATATRSGKVIVTDDDLPSITVSNARVTESWEPTASVGVTAIGYGKPWSFTFTTVDGTAKAGKDYQPVSGTINVPANSTSAAVTIPILDDIEIEGDESFQVVISNPVGAVITQGSGTITISDSDAAFRTIMPDNIAPLESADAAITVRIGSPSPYEISFVATTRSFTAMAGTDFVAATTTLRIPPGQTSVTWTVDLIDDAVFEPKEVFFVDLTNLVNATLDELKFAHVNIVDDDAPANPQTPVLTIVPVSVVEGNSGRTSANVRLELSPAPVSPITVSYSVTDGTASQGSDYFTVPAYETFQAGETVKTIWVVIYGDTVVERDETFSIRIDRADGAIVANREAACVIVNDDVGSQRKRRSARR